MKKWSAHVRGVVLWCALVLGLGCQSVQPPQLSRKEPVLRISSLQTVAEYVVLEQFVWCRALHGVVDEHGKEWPHVRALNRIRGKTLAMRVQKCYDPSRYFDGEVGKIIYRLTPCDPDLWRLTCNVYFSRRGDWTGYNTDDIQKSWTEAGMLHLSIPKNPECAYLASDQSPRRIDQIGVIVKANAISEHNYGHYYIGPSSPVSYRVLVYWLEGNGFLEVEPDLAPEEVKHWYGHVREVNTGPIGEATQQPQKFSYEETDSQLSLQHLIHMCIEHGTSVMIQSNDIDQISSPDFAE